VPDEETGGNKLADDAAGRGPRRKSVEMQPHASPSKEKKSGAGVESGHHDDGDRKNHHGKRVQESDSPDASSRKKAAESRHGHD